MIKSHISLQFSLQRGVQLFCARLHGASAGQPANSRLQHALQCHLPDLHSGGRGLRLSLQPTDTELPDRGAQPRTGQADSQRHPQDEGRATALRPDTVPTASTFRKDVFLLVKPLLNM